MVLFKKKTNTYSVECSGVIVDENFIYQEYNN